MRPVKSAGGRGSTRPNTRGDKHNRGQPAWRPALPPRWRTGASTLPQPNVGFSPRQEGAGSPSARDTALASHTSKVRRQRQRATTRHNTRCPRPHSSGERRVRPAQVKLTRNSDWSTPQAPTSPRPHRPGRPCRSTCAPAAKPQSARPGPRKSLYIPRGQRASSARAHRAPSPPPWPPACWPLRAWLPGYPRGARRLHAPHAPPTADCGHSATAVAPPPYALDAYHVRYASSA